VVAINASVDGGALHVLGLVLLAGHVGDLVLVNVLVGSITITTAATSSISTIDEGLN
jgi:hypothetical protein